MEFEKRRLSKYSLVHLLSVLFLISFTACKTSFKETTQEIALEPRVEHLGDVQVRIANSKIKEGEIGLIELESETGIESAKLKAFELDLVFFHDGEKPPHKKFRAIFPVPYNTAPGEHLLSITVRQPKAETQKKIPITIVSGNYPSETLSVPPKTVIPPKKAMKRIKREQKEIGAIYLQFKAEKLWTKFTPPVDNIITSGYGSRRVYNGVHYNVHYGVDYRAVIGTPIYTPAEGEVVLAKDLYFTGNTVILNHGYGLFTVYAHMSELLVKKGDRVRIRDVLGKSGMTGRASGPHLHWGAVIQKIKVNPLVLLDLLG